MYPNNPYLNPYFQPPQPQAMQQQPQMQVVKVNGENGARAFQMGANSSSLLLDESGALVWLVVTDGAGYKTVSPYDISPHQATPPPDFGSLEQRIAKLEGIVNEYAANSTAASRSKTATGKSGAD